MIHVVVRRYRLYCTFCTVLYHTLTCTELSYQGIFEYNIYTVIPVRTRMNVNVLPLTLAPLVVFLHPCRDGILLRRVQLKFQLRWVSCYFVPPKIEHYVL